MADDLRRKVVLDKLEKANETLGNIQRSMNINDIEHQDNIGELPDFTSSKSRTAPSIPEDSKRLPTWDAFFQHNEQISLTDRNFNFNTYYSLPTSYDSPSIPVFVMHHGAGSSGLSFAQLGSELFKIMKGKCACISFDARGHGQTKPIDSSIELDFGIDAFIDDFTSLLNYFFLTKLDSSLNKQKLSIILVGHSLGGSISSFAYNRFPEQVRKHLLGVAMFDIVEEIAVKALQNVQHFLYSTPNQFTTYSDAIEWHIKQGLSRQHASADISIPALFKRSSSGKVIRITNLQMFKGFWGDWFTGLSKQFVSLPTCKLLILAGNDNLDKDLIIGQMQGKYQLVVFQDSGHFIQEDCYLKTAITLIDFWKRNDNKNVVIKTNWGSKA
ncbi:hypothetical protein KAFR_0D04700 [Kazachstania africana CBS 2517]|uniref:Protein phosphatase methylesterase 1 n=1 Tax=Kazachstania africana (strain ATCC 22294 / BCRC 22015 / CBS 2517 / CECT 1963 / NBRC 1671 / NRRL Y-8276) TaxID=1071382 RepID=H2AUR8_KAZAF|nr:hypothetical protein KAFR_0D04700 [Kazachstania africana CBS 2517]CCF58118.1 hypothetical protein KAFR_0D04700 [Kazachstania africana CBS 2517]